VRNVSNGSEFILKFPADTRDGSELT